MIYPFRYPEVYAELARQGISKTKYAGHLGITLAGLAYKQKNGSFSGEEMKKTALFLQKTIDELFALQEDSA